MDSSKMIGKFLDLVICQIQPVTCNQRSVLPVHWMIPSRNQSLSTHAPRLSITYLIESHDGRSTFALTSHQYHFITMAHYNFDIS